MSEREDKPIESTDFLGEDPSLDSVFGNPESPAEAPASVKADTGTVEEKSDDGAKTTENEGAKDGNQPWQLAAVLDEREKRQAAQKRVEELEARLREMESEDEVPDPEDDPRAAHHYLLDQVGQQMLAQRFDLSRSFMAELHSDFEELESEFVAIARDNPALIQELQQQPNPARFAYEYAKKQRQAKEFQDPDAYREKLKAELRAELEAELRGAPAAKPQPQTTQRPPNLATETGALEHSEPENPSLSDILGR